MPKPYYTAIKRLICVFAILILYVGLSIGTVFANSSYQSATKVAVITVPDGQILHAVLTTPINTKFILAGQTVTMTLGRDFCYNNKMVAPVDSMIYGSVISVTKSKVGKPAEILLRFNQLITPYGIQIPLAAIVDTSNKSGKIIGTDNTYTDDNGNINIPVATDIDLVLTQPITVNPDLYNSNY